MKKTMLVLAVAFAASSAFAQDLTSKKGEPYLPETDDWCVSIEATPLLDFLGNALNGNTSNNSPTWNFLNNNLIITGKMFKDEKTAYRATIRLGMHNHSYTNLVGKDFSTATFPTVDVVEDKLKMGGTFVGLGGGMEMRRGKTRLQGVYGADLLIWMNSYKAAYEYGNVMSPTNTASTTTTPESTDWGTLDFANFAPGVVTAGPLGARGTEFKSGSTIGFGVRGFIGAEYFIFPKISIAGEFGWGLGFSKSGGGTSSYETVGGVTPTVGTVTTETGKSSAFVIDVDQNAFGTGNASLRLNLHF
ncbi:MAG: hypothetical protein IT233_09720 [Bacteroidia bacterium]|nr:hypothetical protein [Bacteroidia bacterium]